MSFLFFLCRNMYGLCCNLNKNKLSGRCVGARLLQSSNRSTAYSSYVIELKLDRMMLGISPHNRLTSDYFLISLRGRCGALEIFKSFHSLQYPSD